MMRPCIYYVNGTAVAVKGVHIFKEVICLYGAIDHLYEIADIIELPTNNDCLYYLQNEESGADYGEKYLIASGGVSCTGCCGSDGTIGAIGSPMHSYSEYINNIQAIKDLLDIRIDDWKRSNLMRLLYIGVCGEMEGYLNNTISSLIQGVRECFLSLREFGDLKHTIDEDELIWRTNILSRINDHYQFHRIRNRIGNERLIYEKLLNQHLHISQELYDAIEWRHKLAHKAPFCKRPYYPGREDVIEFIKNTEEIVNFIDKQISSYKNNWIPVDLLYTTTI